MNRTILLIPFLGLLLTSCINEACDSGIYTTDGKCCNYRCDVECSGGYKEGTCNCECLNGITDGITDAGINDLFDNSSFVQPPQIPI